MPPSILPGADLSPAPSLDSGGSSSEPPRPDDDEDSSSSGAITTGSSRSSPIIGLSDASSLGAGSSNSSSSDDTLAFLRAKQALLRRAALFMRQEEAYNAANARNDADLLTAAVTAATTFADRVAEPPGDGVWAEAREFLAAFVGDDPDTGAAVRQARPSPSPPAANARPSTARPLSAPCPRHPLIDTSLVRLVRPGAPGPAAA